MTELGVFRTGWSDSGGMDQRRSSEVYRDYIEGLEDDFWLILDYFGRDFVETKAKQPPHHLTYSGRMVQSGFHPVIPGDTRNPALPLKNF